MEIRQASTEEAPDVVALAKKALHLDLPWFTWTRDETVGEAVREGNVAVAIEDGDIVGLLWLEEDDEDRVLIEAMAVAEGRRGQGLGRRFVELAKEVAVDRGATILCVGSFLEYGVRPFYEACGFTCLSQELWEDQHPYWYFEMIIMRKTDP